MNEFSLDSFFNSLVSYMAVAFPYMQDEEKDKEKHPKRYPLHLKDAVFNNLQTYTTENSIIFDIGNDTLERTHPYYHILQQAQVIRKKGKGTTKTKGSQASISNVSARDYERVSFNGKTFTKEYSRNVRGARNRQGSVSHWTTNPDGKRVYVNRESNAYYNIHYQYIDKMLDNGIVNQLALDYGMKLKRKENAGLYEEFSLQENQEQGFDEIGNMLSILSSFMEE